METYKGSSYSPVIHPKPQTASFTVMQPQKPTQAQRSGRALLSDGDRRVTVLDPFPGYADRTKITQGPFPGCADRTKIAQEDQCA